MLRGVRRTLPLLVGVCFVLYLFLNGQGPRAIQGHFGIERQRLFSLRFRVTNDDQLTLIGGQPGPLADVGRKILEHYEKRREDKNKSLGQRPRLLRIVPGGRQEDPKRIWETINDWPINNALRLATQLGPVISAASSLPFLNASNGGKGTQLKLELTLPGGQTAIFKPAWYPPSLKLPQGSNPYAGKDRHYGEIAAFHLNLLLGYYAAPIVVGRRLNDIRQTLLPASSSQLAETFFVPDSENDSDSESLCFYGVCHFCSRAEPICTSAAEGFGIDGALVLVLGKKFRTIAHPWHRSYKDNVAAPWESAEGQSYCQPLKRDKPQLVLDIVALSIFDFLIGNGDRHHLELLSKSSPVSSSASRKLLLIDNGKSFGAEDEDYLDILAPLFQCCIVRTELVEKLSAFEGQLGKAMDKMTKIDPLYPLLIQGQLNALDRRLRIVLGTIDYCLGQKKGKVLF